MTQRTSQRVYGPNQSGQPRPNTLIAHYDFAVDGGAVSQITLRGDTVPSGARVLCAIIDVTTVPTSGGAATISVDIEAAADVNAAAAITGSPWSVAKAVLAGKLVAAGDGFKTTADRAVKITVGTAALTAGKFDVIVEYWLPA